MTNSEKFIEIWLDFSLKIYRKNGIDDDSLDLFDKLLDSMEDLKEEFSKKSEIPKEVASIFIDMWAVMDSSATYYDEETQQEIYQMADQLCGYARDICHN